MKNRNYLIAGLIAASLMLISLSSQAQPTRRTVTVNGQVLPVPDDASTGTARAVVGITIPVLPSDICTGSNRNCFNPQNAPINNGASGSQCGWIGNYNGTIATRVPCNGNTLGLGTRANCPAGYSSGSSYSGYGVGNYEDFTGRCVRLDADQSNPAAYSSGCPPNPGGNENITCGSIYVVPSSGYSTFVATRDYELTIWNCPSGYTITQMLALAQDFAWSCIKN
jgi:hypothetical protein